MKRPIAIITRKYKYIAFQYNTDLEKSVIVTIIQSFEIFKISDKSKSNFPTNTKLDTRHCFSILNY